jgi:hypothetical protein
MDDPLLAHLDVLGKKPIYLVTCLSENHIHVHVRSVILDFEIIPERESA